MNTPLTNFWKKDIVYLKNVGPRKGAVLSEELNIRTFEDLLYYFPRKYVDKTRVATINQAQDEMQATFIGKLGHFENVQGARSNRLKATMYDNTGWLELTWFQGAKYVSTRFKPGDEVIVFGKVTLFNGRFSINHPEIELVNDPESGVNLLSIVPFYSTTEKLKNNGLDARGIRRLIHSLLEIGRNNIVENLNITLQQQNQLISLVMALSEIHFPTSFGNLELARRKLKFDELFFFEILLAQRKTNLQPTRIAHPFPKIGHYFNTFYQKYLPFELTNAQKRVIKEIRADVAKPVQMNRLVQGDVGSGKTMVAVMSMLMALDNGFQAAMLAPTEILAEQHFHNIDKFLSPLGIQVDLLVGGQSKKTRQRVLNDLLSGRTHIVTGTHALLEESVIFQNLGLTIIDEQHKFGVMQRSRLWNKANAFPHNMLMTATPIPRTLALTLYGDVDVSIIDELPPGRKVIQTIWLEESRRLEMFGLIKKQLEQGRQAYVVFPLVEESSKLDLLACEAGYEIMKNTFPNYHIGIVHGKMKSDIKEYEMRRFKEKETHILVSTTVIEVGVDVPNATIMVIENAERFGLSQLHQLRGRVGRGGNQSYAVLMSSNKVGYDSKKRLSAMVETNDGFRIAEIDLELRGPGDFLGTRQSGMPEFKLVNLALDGQIINDAKEAAFALIKQDPNLSNPANANIAKYLVEYIQKNQLGDLVA